MSNLLKSSLQNAKMFAASVRYVIRAPNGDVSDASEVKNVKVSPYALMVWGLVYGVLISLCFAVSWKIFGEIYFSEYSRLRLIPIVVVLLIGSIVCFRQLLGFAVTIDRLVMPDQSDDSNETSKTIPTVHFPGQLAVFLLILLKFTALLAMPYQTPWWPADWRRFFNFLYPKALYRVLILAGVWNSAAILLASATGPTRKTANASDCSFRKQMSIKSLLGNLLITFVLTSIYFSSWRNHALGLLVAFILFLVMYLISMLLAWRLKGHDRFTSFACAQIAETLVLLSYLIISRYM
jgi:hypothetical protein